MLDQSSWSTRDRLKHIKAEFFRLLDEPHGLPSPKEGIRKHEIDLKMSLTALSLKCANKLITISNNSLKKCSAFIGSMDLLKAINCSVANRLANSIGSGVTYGFMISYYNTSSVVAGDIMDV
ncbi:hypothetical protein M5K25_019760 [Dendrobium thyrsiflorum]|uniref:Uncharacterized protein n=1 Tax=Dendrobium thyrsiflorum TaxID=117978 RepID=A0ABD0UFN6_DENTH